MDKVDNKSPKNLNRFTRWIWDRIEPLVQQSLSNAIIQLDTESYYLLVLPTSLNSEKQLETLKNSCLRGNVKMVVLTAENFRLFEFSPKLEIP